MDISKKGLLTIVIGFLISVVGYFMGDFLKSILFIAVGGVVVIVGYALVNDENIKTGLHLFIGGIVATAIGYLLFSPIRIIGVALLAFGIFAIGYGFYMVVVMLRAQSPEPDLTEYPVNEPVHHQSTAPQRLTKREMYISQIFDNNIFNYSFKNVFVTGLQYNNISTMNYSAGMDLSLVPTPSNPYDKNAIAVYCNSTMLGHVPKGELQHCILKHFEHGDVYIARISELNDSENTMFFDIAFYTPVEKYIDSQESITVSLVRTSKKDEFSNRQDHYDLLSEGDIVFITYSDYDECFTVSADDYDSSEIGEIKKSDTNKIIKQFGTKDIFGIVEDVTVNDSGKYGADIAIYAR